jgi:TRAP-type C4-dicarboxylate transport system permease large subunit
MPGGIAVMVAAVCALFTTFTGGSGVTIIALGGLVYPILRKDGYSEGFSLGLVTASGSLGLLFPPSLPVILYSVVASNRAQSVPAGDLYLAGILPGTLLVVLTAIYGILIGRRTKRTLAKFSWREVLAAAWAASGLLMPVFIFHFRHGSRRCFRWPPRRSHMQWSSSASLHATSRFFRHCRKSS